ncbi:MAG: cyclic nucleotide-binding domain-containing protein [Clostridia bacterium]|nr:cyclic nucleotide-binding domain-containing protein [Clostridia bacterium]
MNKKVFKKGEVVFREGDQGTNFYQITKGTAGIYLHYGQAGPAETDRYENRPVFRRNGHH